MSTKNAIRLYIAIALIAIVVLVIQLVAPTRSQPGVHPQSSAYYLHGGESVEVACICEPDTPTPSTTPTSSPTPTPSGSRPLKYYGADFVNPGDLATLSKYDINTAMVVMNIRDPQSSWEAYITAANEHNINVVVWPLGGSGACGFPYIGTDITPVHPLLDYLAQQDRFIGIVNAHEPSWSCPMTVPQMTEIRRRLKDYVRNNSGREIQVWNYIDNITSFVTSGEIMDVALTWQHCIGGAEGSCPYAIDTIRQDRAAIDNNGWDHMDLVYAFQTFEIAGTAYRMPTADEMYDWGCQMLQTNALDGFFWYSWRNPAGYTQTLADRQDLWSTISRVYNDCANKGGDEAPTPIPTLAVTSTPLPTATSVPATSPWFGTFLRADAPTIGPWFNQIARGSDMAGAKSQAVHLLNDIIVGQRMVIFASVGAAEQMVPSIADDIDLIGYNIESWQYTPSDEKADPVGSIRRMRILADAYNLQVGLGPDYYFLSSYGEAMAPYTDFFFIQVQAIQDDPERLINFTIETAQALRQANPDIQVAFQLTTAISAGEMIYITEQLESEVDGVWILASASTVDVMQEFVALLRSNQPIDERRDHDLNIQ